MKINYKRMGLLEEDARGLCPGAVASGDFINYPSTWHRKCHKEWHTKCHSDWQALCMYKKRAPFRELP